MSKILNPEPKVIAFLCKWCSSNAADLAGVSRMKYPDNIITIETPCSGRVDPNYIFDSLVVITAPLLSNNLSISTIFSVAVLLLLL